LSTPASKKGRLTLSAIAIALAAYGGLALGFDRLAVWAESDFATYPYRSGESSIRWTLASVFGRSEPTVLLVGPSAIGEDVLYEVLENRLGVRVLSGGIPNATLDDIYLGMDYIRRAYGPAALPEAVVIGLSPRVVANRPRHFGPEPDVDRQRFIIDAIDRYSPLFRVVSTPLGSELQPKSAWERWKARTRFAVGKQQPRSVAALRAAIEAVSGGEAVRIGYQSRIVPFDQPAANRLALTRGLEDGLVGWRPAIHDLLSAVRSPYETMFLTPNSAANIEKQADGWASIYAWNPLDDDRLLRHQFERLTRLLDEHRIEARVVLLPEHPISRRRYRPDYHARYKRYVEGAFGADRVLDLEDILPEDQYHDQIHATYDGARRITEMIADALAAVRLRGVGETAIQYSTRFESTESEPPP